MKQVHLAGILFVLAVTFLAPVAQSQQCPGCENITPPGNPIPDTFSWLDLTGFITVASGDVTTTVSNTSGICAYHWYGPPVNLLLCEPLIKGSPASLGTPQKGPDGPGQQERPRGSRSPPFEASPGPAHPVSQEPRRAPGLARVVPETIEGPESAVRPLQGPFCCGPAIDLEGVGAENVLPSRP